MKPIVLVTLLFTLTPLPAEPLPVTDVGKPERNLHDSRRVEPWKTDIWSSYSGVYEAIVGDGNSSSRLVLTAYTQGNAELLSACIIFIPDLLEEPAYQIHGSIRPNVTTGELQAASIDDWKMVRYIENDTKKTVFGIIVDGRIYVDHTKTKPAEAGAGQPATRPVVEPEDGGTPQPEAERRSR